MSFFRKSYVCANCVQQIRRPSRQAYRSGLGRRYSIKPIVQDGRPFRMAVIGSGPAGFYTAYKVMTKIENAIVDMYEHLPVPYGLVRFGVAPDHPEVKNCQDKFQEVAQSPNFNFIGNVAIGDGPGALPLSVITPHYDAILFAYGASKDRTLGIPGEQDLKGIYSARAFVGWYNGLPEYSQLKPDLLQGEEAVVIGQGNVALDVARVLLSGVDSLRNTDITEEALEALSTSRVKRVRVVGRRGPLQAAFTIKEIRELIKLPGVSFNPIDQSLVPPDIKKIPRAPRRIMELLTRPTEPHPRAPPRTWSLDFRLSPTSFNSSPKAPDQLSSISFEKTNLVPDPFDLSARAAETGEHIDLSCGLAFRSIGYKSEALSGLSNIGVPFDDQRGIIPNDPYGRVLNPSQGPAGDLTARHVPGMYCAGWVKRGPTGVIASTMNDAFATADVIASDWHDHAMFINASRDCNSRGWDAVEAEAIARGCRPVSWQDWETIDEVERMRGKAKGKEREKFTNIEDMLQVLD